jgi:hypothetical protein
MGSSYTVLDRVPSFTDVVFSVGGDQVWLQAVNPEEADNSRRRYTLASANTSAGTGRPIARRALGPEEIEGIAALPGQTLVFNPGGSGDQVSTGVIDHIVAFNRNRPLDPALAGTRPDLDVLAAFRS